MMMLFKKEKLAILLTVIIICNFYVITFIVVKVLAIALIYVISVAITLNWMLKLIGYFINVVFMDIGR